MNEPLRTEQRAALGLVAARTLAELYLAEGQRLAHAGSWAFNAGGFDYWSEELLRIHGLEPGSKPPSTEAYLALVHPEDRDAVSREVQSMLTSKRPFDFTKRIVR